MQLIPACSSLFLLHRTCKLLLLQHTNPDLKRLLLVLITLFPLSQALAQSRIGSPGNKPVEIKHAKTLEFDGKAQKLIGDVTLEQGDMIMKCDSAYKYDVPNRVEAFGHVSIFQGDSVAMYGDYLLYDGDQRKASIQKNVRMNDRSMTLTTDELQYDLNSKTAYYTTGGHIVTNNNNTLTSKVGIYQSNSRELFFKNNVVLVNPQYTMRSDTLKYNTVNNTAYFYGPTTITSNENVIYCENGWYDTNRDISQFSNNATITSPEQYLKADSLVYDRKKGIGRAYRNILLIDTLEKLTIQGDRGEYHQREKISWVAKNAVASKITGRDTLFLHADTLFSINDTISGERYLKAFHKVNIFKTDMQGICDSLTYSFSDSLIKMFNEPVLWSEQNQLTADSVTLYFKNRMIDRAEMVHNAMIISREDSSRFNQIKGTDMTGYFKESLLYLIKVLGNGQGMYYIRDDSAAYIGGIRIDCSDMDIYIVEGHVEEVTFLVEPKGTLYPMSQIPPEETKLKGFQWLENKRPMRGFNLPARASAQ
jgi:lipopolysaccharide export system protein LptA